MRRSRAALVVVAASVGVVASVAPAAAAPFHWSAPAPIGPQHTAGHQLMAVSCPTTSLCAALDNAGNVLTSTTPTATAHAWKRVRVGGKLTAISCPSTSLCVAVDASGNVLSTTRPTGGRQTWKRARIDGTASTPAELSAVSCRSPHFCVAGDNNGDLLTSTNPTGGRHAWKLVLLPSNGDSPGIMSGFSCPTPSLCVGVDQSTGEGFIDDIFTSTRPTGGSNHWQLTAELNDNSFNGVSCPSQSLCVAATAGGEVATSTKPTRSSSWH